MTPVDSRQAFADAIMPYIFGLLAGIVLWLVVRFFFRLRRASGGFWLWEQAAMRRHGIATTAKVLARVDKGFADAQGPAAYHFYELVLEIDREAGPPYRVSSTARLKPSDLSAREGMVVPVRIHPRDPNRVMLDEDEIDGRQKAAVDAKRAADEERARELMSGRDGERR
ncbi:MAG: hypothetical protein ACLP1X_21335 [Polyangiaceae bacterium]